MMRRFGIALLTLALTPVLALLALTLLLLNLVCRVAHAWRRAAPAEEAAPTGLASIVILNWNGKDLLAQGIPSVMKAVARDGLPHEILVVDNGSADGSVEFLQTAFPQVRVLALGITKKVQNWSGLGAALYYESFRRGEAAGYRSCEFSWTLETNDLINRSMQLFGAKIYKRYRIYQKAL